MNYIFGLADPRRKSSLYRSLASYAGQQYAVSQFVLCCQPADMDALTGLLSRFQLSACLELRADDPMAVLRELLNRPALSRLTCWDTTMQYHPWRLARQEDREVSAVSSCFWYFDQSSEVHVASVGVAGRLHALPGTLSIAASALKPMTQQMTSPLAYFMAHLPAADWLKDEWWWAFYEVPRTTSTYLQAREFVSHPESGWPVSKLVANKALLTMRLRGYDVPYTGGPDAWRDIAVCGVDGTGFTVKLSCSSTELPDDTEKDWIE